MRSALLSLSLLLPLPASADALSDLGRSLFFDSALSLNGRQSCASCHQPGNGFASDRAFPEGAVPGHFGTRKPPSLAYQALSPVLHHMVDGEDILFIGGAMTDGRATGAATGSAAAEQAILPMTNPDEMALPHAACAAARACASQSEAMEAAEAGVCALPLAAEAACAATAPEDMDPYAPALALMGRAFAAYEGSAEVMPFSSRYDDYRAGRGMLSAEERAGLALFEGKAQCAACHVLTAGPEGRGPVLTDFTYDNLGVPSNPANPAVARYGAGWVDRGLAATLEQDPFYASEAGAVLGAVKVPTLRNVWTGQPRAYMHNGWFRSLEGVVRFYNTRDVWPRCSQGEATEEAALAARCWPEPEIAATMNRDELGNLKLSEKEEAQIVAFLRTLTDR